MKIKIADACTIAAAMLGCEKNALNSDLKKNLCYAEELVRALGVGKELDKPEAIAVLITTWRIAYPETAPFNY